MEANAIQIPNISELVLLTADISLEHLEAKAMPHLTQLKIVRELIDEFPEVVCCPHFDVMNSILILSHGRSPVRANDRMHKFMIRNHMEITSERVPLQSNVAACIQFTVLNRMAPEWNRVGPQLIQGVNFLERMATRKYRLVDLAVSCVGETTVCLNMKADMCKLYPFEEWQLDLPSKYDPEHCHRANLDNTMHEAFPAEAPSREVIHPSRAVVLPRLTRAQVVGVRYRLQTGSQFANYAELRDYWMDSYGYSLPKESPPCYYEIQFVGAGGKPMPNLLTFDGAVY